MWFFIVIGVLMILPIAPLLRWMQAYHRSIDERLDKDPVSLATFTGVAVPFLIILLHVLKGFMLPWLSENMFYVQSSTAMIVALLTLVFDIWSPLSPNQKMAFWLLTLLGIYSFITPWFLLLAPLVFLGSVLVVNSIGIGALVAIILMFVPIWTGQFDPLFLMVNGGLFIVALFASNKDVFLLLDGKKETVLMTFRKR